MTSPTQGNPMDAITSLLAERQRYEAWIATLETRRASTPPHVYTRVRADYEKRLTAVLEQLSGSSSELEAAVGSLSSRVAELMESENAKRDERAEAELRAAVGEFSPEQWEELSRQSDAEIARLAALRSEVGGELAQVQDLLSRATRKSDAITPPESAPAVAAAAPPASPASVAPAGPRAMDDFVPPPPARLPGSARPPESAPPPVRPTVATPAVKTPDFDELAFLKSVVDAREGGASSPARGAPGRPAGTNAGDDLGALLAGAREAANFGTAPAQGGANAGDAVRRSSPLSQPSQPAPSPSFPASDDRLSKSVPAFLKDVPSEQVKTLKCQECGTMNYPTEWYCERCGGELAAM